MGWIGMIEKDGHPLLTLSDWESRAGPKSANQWKDGRSAKESARAWLERSPQSVPLEVEETLTSHADFSPIEKWVAEPEARVPFDGLRGEPPNIDVLVAIHDAMGPALLVVEAKADEPFGDTVSKTVARARARAEANPRSRGVERVEQLASAILGVAPTGLDEIGSIRYQLLTATAAGQAEAARRGMDRVALLVHEFVTDETTDEKHAANARSLSEFLERLGIEEGVTAGSLVGPIRLAPSHLIPEPTPFYVGEAVRDLRG